MKPVFSVLMLILISVIPSFQAKSSEYTLYSPSGNIKFVLQLTDSKKLTYSVSRIEEGQEKQVVKDSPLGIVRADAPFTEGLKYLSESQPITTSEIFDMYTGKQKTISVVATTQTIVFSNKNGNKLEITVRVYNDGAAFRYGFPEKKTGNFSVTNELTGFYISGTGKTWIQPYDKVTKYSPAYERFFENGIPAGTKAPGEEGWCFPALFETESGWTLITESAVGPNFYAAHLQPEAPDGKYTIRLPEASEAKNTVPATPVFSLPFETPWRVIITGNSLADIFESNLVTALNPRSKIMNPSWIKPGRASWSWWGDWPSPKSFDSLKKFIDLASEMGWEYSLVDANWDLMGGGTIEDLVWYATSKNVGIWMWYNSGGPHNEVTERPRDIMNDPVRRREEFKKLAQWGVKGVKVDFFQSDKPLIIKQYFDILSDAADNRIMVNFHGCTMPRGWNRTWPNLMTMEGVRGAESYGFDSSYPDKALWHNTILPFTRNVAGSMDYTPVTFSNQQFPHKTTFGHELALSVVFESGILHLADRCEPYQSLPEAPKEFLKKVPASWEKSLLLDGYPGKYCVVARKSGNNWYIAGINGTPDKKVYELDLSRLDFPASKVSIITDGNTPKEFGNREINLKPGEKLTVEVLPFGGFVAVLN